MIAAAWRQQRLVALVALGVVGAFAIWLTVTGTMEEHAWASFQHASTGSCLAVAGSRCAEAASNYFRLYNLSPMSLGLLYALPAILGLLLGAPLVAREIEQRTIRMAWTQSITRTRWLLVKLGVGTLICCAIVAALLPLVEWWAGATRRGPRIFPRVFDVVGIVPIAYVLFAFVLGALLGAVIRRSGWAFALGIPIYAGVRYLVLEKLRPDLLSPRSVAANVTNGGVGLTTVAGWQVHAGYVPLGRTTPVAGQSWQSGEQVINDCTISLAPGHKVPANAWTTCLDRLKLHWVTQFQPPDHFWPLQGLEAAVFAAVAVALVALSVVAVRRWRT